MSLQASSFAGRRVARLLGALLLLLPGLGVAQGLRGFPAYAKVISVDYVPGEIQDTARVCYEVATSIPVLDEQEFLRRQMNGALQNATPVNQDGRLVNGPQPAGVELRYQVLPYGEAYLYVNAAARPLVPEQLIFFSRVPRFTPEGGARPITKELEVSSFVNLRHPQYEWVTYCESTPFQKALGGSFVRSLFEAPFLIGSLEGTAEFETSVTLSWGSSPMGIPTRLVPSGYVAPLFGMNVDLAEQEVVISTALYLNSLLLFGNQLAMEEQLNRLRAEYAPLIEYLASELGIVVPETVTVEDVVNILRQVRDGQCSGGTDS